MENASETSSVGNLIGENIRELENYIEHAFVLCGEGPIDMKHLPVEFTGRETPYRHKYIQSAHNILDTQAILTALEECGFNRLAAAKKLGIHKTTLFRKMKKLDIPLPNRDGRSHRRRS